MAYPDLTGAVIWSTCNGGGAPAADLIIVTLAEGRLTVKKGLTT